MFRKNLFAEAWLLVLLVIFSVGLFACATQTANPVSSPAPAESPTAAAATKPTEANAQQKTAQATAPAAQAAAAPTTRVVVDMAGRSVTIPAKINKVATIGSVPVINSFIMAVGDGDKIVNGLPSFAQSPRYKYQLAFAPHMKDLPTFQGSDRAPNVEELLKANPDVTFSMDLPTVETLEKRNIAAIYLAWRDPEDVKKLMPLMGEVFGKQSIAESYVRYFDDTLKKVDEVVSQIPNDQRPKVLYADMQQLRNPHLIVEWWATKAGGISVTNDGRTAEAFQFDMERLLDWNPDVIFVIDSPQVDYVLKDPRFAQIKAVQDKRVYPTAMGAHVWANRTIETPLTVLWAAKKFYPDKFKDLDLEQTLIDFYGKFVDYKMTRAEAKEILDGTVGAK